MENVTSFLSNLISNPFATPVGQLIERATDVTQASEDWSLYMEICDLINESEDGAKDAARAIRKQISNNIGKSNTVIMYTLTILETCVKNCGKPFHVLIAHKDFMQELIRLATPKNNPPQFVLDKVLGLIQTWADAFQGDPDLQEFRHVYDELKEKGCEFPMTDLDRIPPIHTPARSVPPTSSTVAVQQQGSSSVSNSSATNQSPRAEFEGSPFGQGPVQLGADQLAKLHSEFDIVHQNCRVLGDMLTESTPGQVPPDDWQLMRELEMACRQMQHRIVELISRVENEAVTGELLEVNDVLNNVLLRYERFERLCGANTTRSEASSTQPAHTVPAPSYDSVMTSQPSNSSAVPDHSQTSGLQTATLVDLDDVMLDPSAPGNGKKVDEEEFDMFAQSRQSFEQNLPRANRTTYQDQGEDQMSSHGLAAAVTAKSKGATLTGDKDIDEMEQWLKETEVTSHSSAKESATSSEFDSFLETRAKEANLPASDLGSNQNKSNRGGRSLQNAEEEQALFSL